MLGVAQRKCSVRLRVLSLPVPCLTISITQLATAAKPFASASNERWFYYWWVSRMCLVRHLCSMCAVHSMPQILGCCNFRPQSASLSRRPTRICKWSQSFPVDRPRSGARPDSDAIISGKFTVARHGVADVKVVKKGSASEVIVQRIAYAYASGDLTSKDQFLPLAKLEGMVSSAFSTWCKNSWCSSKQSPVLHCMNQASAKFEVSIWIRSNDISSGLQRNSAAPFADPHVVRAAVNPESVVTVLVSIRNGRITISIQKKLGAQGDLLNMLRLAAKGNKVSILRRKTRFVQVATRLFASASAHQIAGHNQ
jgi:hypothetical protein